MAQSFFHSSTASACASITNSCERQRRPHTRRPTLRIDSKRTRLEAVVRGRARARAGSRAEVCRERAPLADGQTSLISRPACEQLKASSQLDSELAFDFARILGSPPSPRAANTDNATDGNEHRREQQHTAPATGNLISRASRAPARERVQSISGQYWRGISPSSSLADGRADCLVKLSPASHHPCHSRCFVLDHSGGGCAESHEREREREPSSPRWAQALNSLVAALACQSQYQSYRQTCVCVFIWAHNTPPRKLSIRLTARPRR